MGKAPGGRVPVVVMGLGFIGQQIARAALSSPELELVGAVDPHPNLVGKTLGEVLGKPCEIRISDRLEHAIKGQVRGVLLHATRSRLTEVMDELKAAFKHGLSVCSTCEELAFPYLRYPELADELSLAAEKAGVTVLGTGVNPGFVLDRLVAVAAQGCGAVRHVHAERVVDARTRREALQRKVGAGLTEEAFLALADEDRIGHVGILESAALAALGAGIECDDFEEELVPVLAEEDIDGLVPVKAGQVAGMFQSAVGLADGVERVRIELTIALGAEPAADRIVIDADPRVELEIKGGMAGDVATANLVVNAAPRLIAAEPGLITVLELPAGR